MKENYEKILNTKSKRDKYDDSMFEMALPNGDYAVAMGDEFNPVAYDVTLEEMLAHIESGIQMVLASSLNHFTWDDLGEYTDFFESEFKDDDGMGLPDSLTGEYVLGKMVCGKGNAKSFF